MIKIFQSISVLTFILLNLLTNFNGEAQVPAFPGAEGFGQFATGGRDGEVYVVTNLNDSGEGSLRKGIVRHGKRTILFAVSGTINLESRIDINNGDLTILGQTAPGEGITIKGYPVTIKSDNIIIRYLRFRMGDLNKVEGDAFGGRDLTNVIIDHCSISWAVDENASFYHNKDFTMQWCIISEALNSSVHHKGDHGYGGIWGGIRATFHHNLIASNNSRNPRLSGSATTKNSEREFVDLSNNVIYNWQENSIYGGEKGHYNIINNYFKPGPATPDSKKARILEPYEPYGEFYIDGNFVVGSEEVSKDNWNGGIQGNIPAQHRRKVPVAVDNLNLQGASAAYIQVLKYAGASLFRDAVDARIVRNVRNGDSDFKEGIIDSQTDVGGWPDLKKDSVETDTDNDGIPDNFENELGSDPKVKDAYVKAHKSEYTFAEHYADLLVRKFDFTVDPTGMGDFKTVQEAIDAVPDFRRSRTVIYIRDGIYKEKLVLPASKTNVTFIGESRENTVITYDDYAQKLNAFGEEVGTTGSTSFFVFGDGFHARDLTFENSAGPVGQAVAVRVDGDKVIFDNCRFLGFQDTLYLHGKQSRQYYRNCYIEGTVDFIFGWSTGYFENCDIVCKNGGYVTAASTDEHSSFGFVFKDCRLISDAGQGTFYLGRPWRDHAKTVWISCFMDAHIKPEGWHNWNKPNAESTVYYGEYDSKGPGANGQRVPWAKELTKEQAAGFSKEEVLKGEDNWIPELNDLN
ncbi:pectinesterase family protein [Robertkochia solimangrovi]|uniref:pectinesterase family protein n=1 Tax=Robertkochia solimangrovi TaxID=2213046 RepID=UPI00117D22AB|nr:pectinesterase family protein [Robertkochia solimangrovi]TRZ43696.1 pectin methylesterase [Robertkochia solimangrovi]